MIPRFEILATHGAARAGRWHTQWGAVETPVFMPVGTRGAIKNLTAAQVAATGAKIILGNTYHLVVHPGCDVVESLGGLHAFTGWRGPMLTDSGGFQVFSLADARKIDDEGVTFQSPRTGDKLRFTPTGTIEWQRQLGSDFVMQLDECTPWPCDYDHAARAVDRSLKWATLGREVPLKPHQIFLPIVQGSTFPDLRARSAQALAELDTTAIAIGGLSVGEGQDLMLGIIESTLPHLPPAKPRYLMGVGTPDDLLQCIARGIDMFDCVMPTRNARHALAFTAEGPLRLRNAKHARDTSPLDPTCPCYACTGGPGFSRGYLRHLCMVGEATGNALLTIHNITYYQRLVAAARQAILDGRDVTQVKL